MSARACPVCELAVAPNERPPRCEDCSAIVEHLRGVVANLHTLHDERPERLYFGGPASFKVGDTLTADRVRPFSDDPEYILRGGERLVVTESEVDSFRLTMYFQPPAAVYEVRLIGELFLEEEFMVKRRAMAFEHEMPPRWQARALEVVEVGRPGLSAENRETLEGVYAEGVTAALETHGPVPNIEALATAEVIAMLRRRRADLGVDPDFVDLFSTGLEINARRTGPEGERVKDLLSVIGTAQGPAA